MALLISDACASHPCFSGGTCESYAGYYYCTCPYGTTGDICQFLTTGEQLTSYLHPPPKYG